MEVSESAKKQENTGIGPASACRGESAFTRHESAATQLSCATAGRTKHQPAAAGNDRRLGSPVSGLLFTGNGATPTCPSRQQGQEFARRYGSHRGAIRICSCARGFPRTPSTLGCL